MYFGGFFLFYVCGGVLLTKSVAIVSIFIMALLDLFKKRKKKDLDDRLKRPPKGAFKKLKTAKTEKEEKPESKEEKQDIPKIEHEIKQASRAASLSILSPHVTEKSTILSESGVYVFKVSSRSNKIIIKHAINELYGVVPEKINIVSVPSKTRRVRGKRGTKSGYKKAMIYLKKGDKIEIT